MIIRNQVTKTLKASPLNNRGCERSEHPRIAGVWVTSTLKGSPVLTGGAPVSTGDPSHRRCWGTPFGVLFSPFSNYPQVVFPSKLAYP